MKKLFSLTALLLTFTLAFGQIPDAIPDGYDQVYQKNAGSTEGACW